MSKKFSVLLGKKMAVTEMFWNEALHRQSELTRRIKELEAARADVRSLGRAHEIMYGLTEWEDDAKIYHVAFVRSFKTDNDHMLTDLNAFRDIRLGSDNVPENVRLAYCHTNGLAVDDARRAFLHLCHCGGRRIRVMQRWMDEGPPVPSICTEIGEICLSCRHYRRRYHDDTNDLEQTVEK